MQPTISRTGMATAAAVCAALLALAGWQRSEYLHQRELIRARLASQADAISSALVSGVRSHRWISPYYASQLPKTLKELAGFDHVLAVAIVPVTVTSSRGEPVPNDEQMYAAGDTRLIDRTAQPGARWSAEGYYWVRLFALSGGGPGMGLHDGGRGMGRRRGMGGGPPWMDGSNTPSTFKAILVLDRSGVDQQLRREATIRLMLVGSGSLLILLIAFSWRATIRLAAARGRARLLETQTQYLADLGQAGAGLAHETRNPLGLIRGWAQRLAEQGLPSREQQEQAEAIVEECDRVTSRINEFLAFARPLRPRFKAVAVRDLLEQLNVVLVPDLEAQRITIDYRQIPVGATILADAEQFRQVVFNLVGNAIAFAGEGGRIDLQLRRNSQEGWRLEVRDSGPGPDQAAQSSLFKPYFTTRADGTGLGLAIVKNISTAHGWTVGYTPESKGSGVFWVDGISSAS